ncbi:YcxB family protein [Streptomyces sp. NBC_00094]|uniref:YcxB family protein n=1 Tax=Streptomyces sp. NBC_00094 TaxID=2903620 RepID=UPI00225A5E57|nr:YcxB family protein [Streptomyces sp. NBC_00094]MCX5393866.1 YcxB family protein [Streptomyces sp. NBC_00094]
MVMDSGQDGTQAGIQAGTQAAVELVYRPTRADILTAVLVRERLRRLHIVRWAFTLLFGGSALLLVAAQRSFTVSIALAGFCAALIWAVPHFQAHHALRTVEWQGEYRTSVSGTGITAETAHVTLLQRWSVFRGYRETRDHVVLLSRDPNILLVEVLPKRGLGSPEETERLLDVVGRHLTRV